MNTGLSLVSEMLERRDRLKAQHLDALKKLQTAHEEANYSDQAHYRGLETGLDMALLHIEFLLDLAKAEGL
jgi:hypothetical protein